MVMSVPQKLPIYLNEYSVAQLLAFIIALALTISMLVGYYSRTCTLLLAIASGVVYNYQSYGWPALPFSVQNLSSHTFEKNVIYFAYFGFLLSFTPCGAVLSIDAVRRNAPVQANGQVDSPAIFGMRLLLITVYFWTAFSKCNPTFLSGAVFESILVKSYFGSFYYAGTRPELLRLYSSMAWFIVVFEFALAFALLFKRTRRFAIFCGISMHAVFLTILPVYHFSFILVSSYLIFVDQNTIERSRARLMGLPTAVSG